MITKRASNDRGHFDHGWLKTYHTLSFADYYDPEFIHFRSLRVINEDFVAPGQGFGTHPHRDMEIITYILEGELQHKDSMGTGSIIRPGEVQHMSAGTGVFHSEFNPSTTTPVHLLQIWIIPKSQGIAPRYSQKMFPENERLNALRLVVSPDGRDGSISIHQNADLYVSLLDEGRTLTHSFARDRAGYVQVTDGSISLGDTILNAGDGATITQELSIEITAQRGKRASFLLFDLE